MELLKLMALLTNEEYVKLTRSLPLYKSTGRAGNKYP